MTLKSGFSRGKLRKRTLSQKRYSKALCSQFIYLQFWNRRTFSDRLAKTDFLVLIFSIRQVVRMWVWNSFNNFLTKVNTYVTLWYISFLLSGTICVFDPHLLFRTLTNFINLFVRQKKILPCSWKVLGSNISFSSDGFVIII